MRHTEAYERWDRHEISTPQPSVHATAALIGDTWLTTATVCVPGPLGQLEARRPHPLIELHQRLTTFGGPGRVGSPVVPRLGRHVGVRTPS